MVLSAATYLDDEAVLRHLKWLTPEEVDKILERRDAEAMNRLGVTNPTGQAQEGGLDGPQSEMQNMQE